MKAHSVRKHLSITMMIRVGDKDIMIHSLKRLKEQHIPGVILEEIKTAIASFIACLLELAGGNLVLMAHSIVRL